jgi:3-hydroxyisobutyrate dehydrogenase
LTSKETRLAKVAYIGVGNMGEAKILRLLGAGHQVTAYNRTVDKTRKVQAAGAAIAPTPAAAVAGADVVMSSVTNDEASRAVWTGPDGILSGPVTPAMLLAECSTLSHDWVVELAGIVRGRGLRYIDLPVAGRPDAAEAGELRVYAGCSKEELRELEPVLAAFSKKIFHFGPAGAGTAFKLIYNLLGVIQVASVAEAMVQCEAAGIDLHVAADAFALGYTGSKHVAHHSAVMAEGKRNQPVGFSGRGRLKDSQYGVQLAEKLARQALIGKAASAVFAQMVDTGMGELNDSELIDALRAIAAKR